MDPLASAVYTRHDSAPVIYRGARPRSVFLKGGKVHHYPVPLGATVQAAPGRIAKPLRLKYRHITRRGYAARSEPTEPTYYPSSFVYEDRVGTPAPTFEPSNEASAGLVSYRGIVISQPYKAEGVASEQAQLAAFEANIKQITEPAIKLAKEIFSRHASLQAVNWTARDDLRTCLDARAEHFAELAQLQRQGLYTFNEVEQEQVNAALDIGDRQLQRSNDLVATYTVAFAEAEADLQRSKANLIFAVKLEAAADTVLSGLESVLQRTFEAECSKCDVPCDGIYIDIDTYGNTVCRHCFGARTL